MNAPQKSNLGLPFTETQRIRQWWVWLLLLSINALAITAVIVQVGLGRPFGDNPSNDIGVIFTSLFTLALTFLMATIKLETEVTSEAVKVRLYPFQMKMRAYPWNEIASFQVRKYSPLGEYGGWGLRFSMKGNGRALTISGNHGFQLQFRNGDKLLIGTRKGEDLRVPIEVMGSAA